MDKAQKTQNDSLFFIRDFASLCLSHWVWFVISLVICLSIGALKILKTQNIYNRSAIILIKETLAKRTTSEMEALLTSGGISQTNTRLTNEIVAFTSPDLVREVVARLNLEVNCYSEGRFKDTVLYGSTCPVTVKFLPGEERPVKFHIEKNGDELRIFDIEDKFNRDNSLEYRLHEGDTVYTVFGVLRVDKNSGCSKNWNSPLLVTRSDQASITSKYVSRISAEAHDLKNMSDLIDLSIKDESPERATDVLNMLIAIYNENWVKDRNMISRATAYFINERLDNIERDLSLVDDDISSFKSRNLLPDINAVSSMYMKKSEDIESQTREIDNQLHIIKYTRNFLANLSGNGQLIPAPSGITNSTIATQITEYNTMQMQRNRLVEVSSEINPLVKTLDANLKSLRETVMTSLDNEIVVLQSQLARLENSEKQATARLADNPNQAKYLLNVERQQKVKETLYLYLLQKREENELSQTFTAYNTKVMSKPNGSNVPVSPQSNRIMLIALIIGLVIPAGILYLQGVLNTKIRGKKDLESLTLPLLGEIPQNFVPTSRLDRKLPFKKHVEAPNVPNALVKAGQRNAINEAFRVLRTNLEFVAKSDNSKVFAITSFNVGSGKSFISLNLSSAIAISGKKVLLIDGDLRHASTSKVTGSKKGIADYLSGNCESADGLTVNLPEIKNLDILPVGTIPPNPTELISNAKFGQLLDKYRKEYDFILVDCPPIEVVADTQIIEEHVDRTLFIIRAGLFERAMLPYIENMKDKPEYKNVSVVLNGTDMGGGYYGRYGYGYRYGYASGYGYHNESYYYTDSRKK